MAQPNVQTLSHAQPLAQPITTLAEPIVYLAGLISIWLSPLVDWLSHTLLGSAKCGIWLSQIIILAEPFSPSGSARAGM
jgi:hypothetical protein